MQAMASLPSTELARAPRPGRIAAAGDRGGVTVTQPVATSMVSWKAPDMSTGAAGTAGSVGWESGEQPAPATSASARDNRWRACMGGS